MGRLQSLINFNCLIGKTDVCVRVVITLPFLTLGWGDLAKLLAENVQTTPQHTNLYRGGLMSHTAKAGQEDTVFTLTV